MTGKNHKRIKQITAALLLFALMFLQPLSALSAQAAVTAALSSQTLPAASSAQTVQSYDAGWKQNEAGKWTYLKNGSMLRSAWIRDLSGGSRWYVLDENGVMAEGPLVLDASTGRYYLLNNTVHDGTFGSMITEDGTWYGQQLSFHKAHDGFFGSLENEAQIRILAGLLGVQEVKPAATLDVGKAAVAVSSGDEEESLPDTHIYSITYDFAGGDDYYENPRGYTKVSEKITLTAPEREGYTFLGWTEGSLEDQPDISVVIPRGTTGNKHFTAHWAEQICTVKVEVNDPLRGSVETKEVKVPYGAEVRADGTDLLIGETRITAAATPSTAEKAYTLHDWAAPLSIKQDATVYANFTDGTDLCTVTFLADMEGKPSVTVQLVKGSRCYPESFLHPEGFIVISWWDEAGNYFNPELGKIDHDMDLTAAVTKDLFEEFRSLEHVLKVKKNPLLNQYYLYFEQPLDWDTPELGTFIQKVQVILTGQDQVNILHTEGYCNDANPYISTEPANLLNGNYISAEHRFFGCSVPTGLCPESAAYWQYLTTENAAADKHRVRTELATILPGKWVSTGSSKGGLTTNLQALYYPEDCDVWMPYVAPLCNSIGDERFMEFLNETIGDDYFGQNDAAAMRQCVMDIQCWCEENRNAVAPAVWNQKIVNDGLRVADSVTPEVLLELCLLDFQAQCWQSRLSSDPVFSDLKALRDQLEDPGISMEAKTAAVVREVGVEGGYECNSFAYPYYIQSFAEIGQYYWTTAYLQEALDKRGTGVKTVIPADADAEYFRDLILTDALKSVIRYDSSTYEEMIDWIGTTDQKIMMLFGSCDPWTSVRIPADNSKENIRIYIIPGSCHNNATLRYAGKETMNQALKILYGWLGISPKE